MRCEEPVKIIEILRLWEQGYSQREIAASVKCAKSTVGEVQRRCKEHSLYEHEPDEQWMFVWLSFVITEEKRFKNRAGGRGLIDQAKPAYPFCFLLFLK